MSYEKNGVVTFVLVAIGLLMVALGGYLIYDNLLSVDNNISNNIDTAETSLSIDDAIVQNIYEKITGPRGEYKWNLYFYSNESLSVSTFDDAMKHVFAYYLLNYNQIKIIDVEDPSLFAIENDAYKENIEKIFGPDVYYKKDSEYNLVSHFEIADSSGVSFKYNESTGRYEGTAGGIGGNNSPLDPLYTKLISAVKKKDLLILTEKYIIVEDNFDLNEEEFVYNIYADYKKKTLLDTFTLPFDEAENASVLIDDYLDEAGTVVYTFKLNGNGNYYFHSSELR